ncbi:4-coumarate-CoA ligase [Paraphoma chrysanthemicola]|nr:4-coumarate-CoA ligase [Paraphoma chrysanthemicola]
MVYTSDYVLDYPTDATISDLFFDYNLGGASSTASAILDGLSGETFFTYASLRLAVRRFAKYLQETLRVQRGDVVCILSFNTVYYPVYVHAVLAVGGVVSALNPLHVPKELSHVLSIARPKHALVAPELVANLREAMNVLEMKPQIVTLLTTTSPAEYTIDVPRLLEHGDTSFIRPIYAEGEIATELAFICFSSGTSGLPKGVKLSHGNVVSNVYMHSIYLSDMFTPSSVFALVVPFFHILGLSGFVCQYVLNGAPIVVFPRFDLASLLHSIERDKVTHLNVVPPIALQLANSTATAGRDFSSLKCLMSAAAPLEQSSADRLCQKLDCVLTQWYGLTEASPSVISQRYDQVNIKGTLGKLLPGMTLKIVDPEGKECPPGIAGELWVKGPNVMQGYIGNTSLTDETITSDRYLRTGDIGYVNDDGFVFLVDRLKEMIKVNGNQVAPAELEGILRMHPDVEDAAVRGVYIASRGTEVPVAHVVTKSPRLNALEDILRFVNERVSRYKKIQRASRIEEIPRNAGGKIVRRMLPNVDWGLDVIPAKL